MGHKKLLTLTACLASSLALAGCCNTSSRCCSGVAHARTSSTGEGGQFACDASASPRPMATVTAFATSGREEESTPLWPLSKIQRASAEFAPVPTPQPERAEKNADKPESILAALARQYGYTAKPSGPVEEKPPQTRESRDSPRRFFNRGIARRQFNRMVDTFGSDGKPHSSTAKPPPVTAVAQAPDQLKAVETPAMNPLMEQIHRDATALSDLPSAPTPPAVGQAQKDDITLVSPAAHEVVPSPAQPRAVTVALTDEPARTSQGIVQISARFGHSADYTCLCGEVQQFRKAWRLRYAGVDETDEHGGSVLLAGDTKLDGLRDGQHIRVQGRIVDRDERTGRVFHVQSLERLDR